MKLNLITALLIILLLGFVFGWFGFKGISTASIFESSSSEKTTETTTTYYNTTEVPATVDLCSYFQPIIIRSDLVSSCNALGGNFICDDMNVGCYDTAGLIDCSGVGFNIVNYECNHLGGTYYCSDHDAYCRY